jgi:hypothetical protein
MKIGEILEELKRGKTLVDLGKELVVGKEKLSKALKGAGYEFSRKNGWTFKGKGEEPLNQEYTDFVKASKPSKGVKKSPTNVQTKEPKNERTLEPTFQPSNVITASEQIKQAKAQTAPTKEQTKQETNQRTKEGSKQLNNEPSNVVRKRSSFDLDVELMKELKIQAVIHDKNIYEMVETAIRQYLGGLK